MDLSVYSLPRLVKEKRERQPNWTEHEKQLLLSLTRNHQAILENKGSDTMTLKRKSDAWNEISLRMNAAGYNRSKERLKQQLGRIRAAEAKRMKEALESSLPLEGSEGNKYGELRSCLKLHANDKANATVTSSSLSPGHEELHIKAEMIASTDNESNAEDIICPSPSSKHCNEDNENNGSSTVPPQHNVMRLMVQNIPSTTGSEKFSIDYENSSSKVNTNKNEVYADQGTDIVGASKPKIKIDKLDVENSPSLSNKNSQKKCRSGRSIRLTGLQIPPRKEQRVRQIHMYRVAVERERLRALKLQQKRDRILHRKDIEIQDLKLQILRNITNQTREANRINF